MRLLHVSLFPHLLFCAYILAHCLGYNRDSRLADFTTKNKTKMWNEFFSYRALFLRISTMNILGARVLEEVDTAGSGQTRSRVFNLTVARVLK